MEIKIDAKDKILGRLASETALALRGKKSPGFSPEKLSGVRVTILNTDKIKVTGKKPHQKLYRRHSGYLGGLKEEKLRDLMARDSREVLKRAVMGMLPKNRLRRKLIRNLTLYHGGEK